MMSVLPHYLQFLCLPRISKSIWFLFSLSTQSCCTASAMADVLSCACADTSTSQLSALLNLHKNVMVLQKERSSRMLEEVEDSLSKLSKVPSHKPSPSLNDWWMLSYAVQKIPLRIYRCCNSLCSECTVGFQSHRAVGLQIQDITRTYFLLITIWSNELKH